MGSSTVERVQEILLYNAGCYRHNVQTAADWRRTTRARVHVVLRARVHLVLRARVFSTAFQTTNSIGPYMIRTRKYLPSTFPPVLRYSSSKSKADVACSRIRPKAQTGMMINSA